MQLYELQVGNTISTVIALLAGLGVSLFFLFYCSFRVTLVSLFFLALVLSAIDFEAEDACGAFISPGVCVLESTDCDKIVPGLDADPEFGLYKNAVCQDLPASKSKLFFSYSTRFFADTCSAEIEEARARIADFNKSQCGPLQEQEKAGTTALPPSYLLAAGAVGLVVAGIGNIKISA
jgi:hypothetical protein